MFSIRHKVDRTRRDRRARKGGAEIDNRKLQLKFSIPHLSVNLECGAYGTTLRVDAIAHIRRRSRQGFRLYLKRRNAHIRLVVEPSSPANFATLASMGKLGCGLSNSKPFYPRTAINSGPRSACTDWVVVWTLDPRGIQANVSSLRSSPQFECVA